MKDVRMNCIFDDTEIAFKNRSDKELKKIYSLFKKMSNQSLSNIGMSLLKASIFFKLPVHKFAEKYLFFHFCGGVNLEDSSDIIENLNKFNVKAVLDYSVESKKSEEAFEEIKKEIIKIIDNSYKNKGKVPFAVYKISGVANVELIRKIQKNESLSDEEKTLKEKLIARIDEISSYAHKKQVPLMVDAEKLDVQGFITDISNEMMIKYNKDMPIIYDTIQFYRKDAMQLLKDSFKKVTESGAFYGLKLVRGAYYEEEKLIAEKLGKESPICKSKKDTDEMYNTGIQFCMKNLDKTGIFLATHNEISVKLLMQLIDEYSLELQDKRVWFSQLYGMSEHISFNIAKCGYNASKYIPYGPIKSVMPYLIRRAEENKGIQEQTNREFEVIKKEMRRRKLMK